MRKKYWIAVAAIFVLAALSAVTIPALLPPTPGVTYANYNRIEKGMTRADVERLLGEPHQMEATNCVWFGNEMNDLFVVFDENDRVKAMGWNGRIDVRSPLQRWTDRIM